MLVLALVQPAEPGGQPQVHAELRKRFVGQPQTREALALAQVGFFVLTASGLESFEREFAGARDYDLDGVRVRVLPLERVIVSKRAASRPQDTAQIRMLEAARKARE